MNFAYFFLLCVTFHISCTSDTGKATKGKNDSAPGKGSELARDVQGSDTIIISSKAAVVYEPDSMKIAQLKTVGGEEDFYRGADDYIFYLNESADYLKKKGVAIIQAKNKKYLKFISSGKSITVIKLDTLTDPWGMFFFQPGKQPRLVDIVSIDEEFNNYY